MTTKECISWLKVMRANLNIFPNVSSEKKAEALQMAIEAMEKLENLNERGRQ